LQGTVNKVLHFRPLTQNKIEVLLEILENGMVRNDEGFAPLPYYETVDLFCDCSYQNQTENFDVLRKAQSPFLFHNKECDVIAGRS
jgi:hypothetical protein